MRMIAGSVSYVAASPTFEMQIPKMCDPLGTGTCADLILGYVHLVQSMSKLNLL